MEGSLARLDATLAEQEQALAELLAEAGADAADDLRRRARICAQRDQLAERVASLLGDLERRLGRGEGARSLRDELAEGLVSDWDALRQGAAADAADADREREAVLRRHEELRLELEELAVSGAVMERELRRAELVRGLEEASARWRRLHVAGALIERTLDRFERERQPGVLREASRFFSLITEGRYERVSQSAEGDVFEVIEPGGARKSPDQLSRGTAEQLYLCVRLGLVAEFERRSRALPLVMDDVLVNFDDERAAAAANLLAAFAREGDRQLLFFTCNARTRELLREADPEAELRELSPSASARS